MLRALVASLALISAASCAQETSPHERSTPPFSARYEIVQSQLGAVFTFKLDRFAGVIEQLFIDPETHEHFWKSVPVQNAPMIAHPSTPRFQIFMSGIAAKYTYLIDTASGDTWLLVTSDGRSNCTWERLHDEKPTAKDPAGK
jgi:hypothetical protein